MVCPARALITMVARYTSEENARLRNSTALKRTLFPVLAMFRYSTLVHVATVAGGHLSADGTRNSYSGRLQLLPNAHANVVSDYAPNGPSSSNWYVCYISEVTGVRLRQQCNLSSTDCYSANQVLMQTQ